MVSDRDFGRLEGKVSAVHEDVKEIKAALSADGGLEARVRHLENWRWYVLGIFAAAGALVSAGFVLL